MIREAWDGTEWQEHCQRLLAMRYGENIQFIPDRDRGDGGLEAYRLDSPVAYQCYAAQDAYDVTALTNAQKGKMRRDLKKLTDAPEKTASLIGSSTRLIRWVLLAPNFDSKDIVSYAREKSKEIRSRTPCPSWCDAENFEVVIADDSEFSHEKSQLYGVSPTLELTINEPTLAEVAAGHSDLRSRLLPKLQVDPILRNSEDDLKQYSDEIIIEYVRGGRQLEILESEYGMTFAAISRRATSTLRNLTRTTIGIPGTGPQVVNSLTRQLAEDFRTDAPAVSAVLCDELARYFTSCWFIDCPLRFSGGAA